MAEEVKLFGFWASPFSRRVELALKLKGIKYEYIEEDLAHKSSLLLKYNPISKKVPVLVHNEKAIMESLVILEYIDETWKNNPILPQDPHDRAMARFWANFIDEKVLRTAFRISIGQEKEKQQAIEEADKQLKLLEKELKGKDFFGGDTIGYVDIAANIIAFWFAVGQEVSEGKWFTEERYRILWRWKIKYQENVVANQCRPPRDRHLEFTRALHKASYCMKNRNSKS